MARPWRAPSWLEPALALYASQVERAEVQLDRFTVEVDRPGLPPDGIVVLHLSDFHFRAGGRVQARKIARLKQLLAGERYDIVALDRRSDSRCGRLPGRALTDREPAAADGRVQLPRQPRLRRILGLGRVRAYLAGKRRHPRIERGDLLGAARKLVDFARKVLRNELVRLPVAFNDMAAMDAGLISAGVQPLVNTAVQVPGADLWVAGVDDLTEGFPDLRTALAGVPDEPPVILLAHNPDIWLNARVAAADLVLSGHTHGGQVRLPGVGVAHTQGTHLSRQRPAGWFERDGTRMFVSRGLGESIPLRFGVRPQVALIRLISK